VLAFPFAAGRILRSFVITFVFLLPTAAPLVMRF
jgi:hypothetical protein